jgi:hypothetical protein
MADEIIRELWQIKDDIAREYGYDLDALVAHLRSCESRSGRTIVDLESAKKRADQLAVPGATTPRR